MNKISPLSTSIAEIEPRFKNPVVQHTKHVIQETNLIADLVYLLKHKDIIGSYRGDIERLFPLVQRGFDEVNNESDDDSESASEPNSESESEPESDPESDPETDPDSKSEPSPGPALSSNKRRKRQTTIRLKKRQQTFNSNWWFRKLKISLLLSHGLLHPATQKSIRRISAQAHASAVIKLTLVTIENLWAQTVMR